eukprot:14138298-Alexandrium_andersonii.AAC.1
MATARTHFRACALAYVHAHVHTAVYCVCVSPRGACCWCVAPQALCCSAGDGGGDGDDAMAVCSDAGSA